MSSNWVKIYTSDVAYKAELIKAVLKEEASIDSIIIDKKDSMHTHLQNGGVEIYVSPDEVVKAKHIITKNEL